MMSIDRKKNFEFEQQDHIKVNQLNSKKFEYQHILKSNQQTQTIKIFRIYCIIIIYIINIITAIQYPPQLAYIQSIIIQQYKPHMEIAISIILFIVAAFVVISVFCFISWLFHRKHGDYVPPLEEQLDAAKGENDPYLQNQKRNNAPKEIQMQNFQPTPFKLNFSKMSQTDNMLSNRILNSFPNTSRTKNQTSFRNPFQNQLTPSNYNDDEKKNVKHNYISKLANYTSKGIELYEKQLMSIKNVKIFKDLNWVEEIKENFTVRKQLYNAQIDNFEDILDIIKLQLGQYGAIKFVTQIQIRSCQYDKQYNVDLLIKNQRFELISVEEYEEEKYKLQAI